MKSKMLGALALFTLIGALFILQSAGTGPPTVNAATGSIDALNVGTCLTTDATVFKGDCDQLSNDADDWEVREEIAEVTTLYATYAHDPRTASDAPRAILEDSDLLKISIADADRDKRSGVLVRGASNEEAINANVTEASLRAKIKADLDMDQLDYEPLHDHDSEADTDEVIKYTSEDDETRQDGIWMRRAGSTAGVGDSIIATSGGGVTLNFERDGCNGAGTGNVDCGTSSTGPDWGFDPADFDVENGAEVRFYGCLAANGVSNCNGDGVEIERLDELTIDEDRSNGEADEDTAPWLAVNASIPNENDIIILAIYYQTSDREDLVGDEQYRHCGDGDSDPQENNNNWTCASGTLDMNHATTNVVYTDKEIEDNTELLVRASSDGDDRWANLHLKETGIFEGRYEGYLRLTDPNGDGSADKDNASTTNINEMDPQDWGRKTIDGSIAGEDSVDKDGNLTPASAAVLGVQSGPVTIEYRDSSGSTQRLRIEIDNAPPAVTITSPAHGDSSGDQSPDFAGVIEDSDSGLADKSFRLVVDNEVDNDGKNEDFALNGKALNANAVKGTDSTPTTSDNDGLGKVTHIGQYSGYVEAAPFGTVPANNLYNLGDDSCDNNESCYIESESYDDGANRASFDDSIRLDLQDSAGDEAVTRDAEFEIDFQAFVMDMAGNIGFSDSDPANPRFINDLGEAADDRTEPNVLGYYSAHIITLDEKDPVINVEQSATGFFGRSNDKNIADRYGVMVVFDGPIAADTVSTNTFSVELDDETSATVADVDVDGKYVFLKLASELASDATPKIDIANGEKVEDMAGNETYGREQDEFEAADGISPRLTVTLSGGSGTGTGNEGPDKLTKDKITVHVSSDEMLQSAPRIAVVCSSLRWNEGGTAISRTDKRVRENTVGSRHDIDDFVANRSGSFTGKPIESPVMTAPRISNTKATATTINYQYTCGYDTADDNNFGDNFQFSDVSSLSRPGENWEYTWQNLTGDAQKLLDGDLTAVAFGRDRSRYENTAGSMVENWGSASAEFTLDTALLSPQENGGGDLQPEDGGESKESRPFILIEFTEGTTVTLDSVELDDVEIADQFTMPAMNRFVYWPDTLSQGDHEVEVEATDAANNEVFFEYAFKVVERGDFVIELQAGWNAISVPASPVATAIGSVFTDSAITTVIGWDTQGWRIAVRRDGVWESNQQYGALNDIQSKYGYWVKSDRFVSQPVALQGPLGRDAGSPGTPVGIDTLPGWNFVGVIDQDGDQTEGHFGESLRSGSEAVTAGVYLGSNYIRAYTWDPTFSRFENLPKNTDILIGSGVWVYYEGGIAP